MKRLKSNNKGFSLIELLVGVAILGVIVIPLLNSFVVSANTARKNKLHGDATTILQNISEQIEAVPLEELLINKNDFWIESANVTFESPVIAPTESPEANLDYYKVLINDLNYAGEKYKAEVILDARDPDTVVDGSDTATVHEINTIEIVDIGTMDVLTSQERGDASSNDPDARSFEAIKAIAEVDTDLVGILPVVPPVAPPVVPPVVPPAADPDDLECIEARREINIVIEKSGDFVNGIIQYKYTYDFKKGAKEKSYSYKDPIYERELIEETPLFSTPYKIEDNKYPTIYYLYLPFYKAIEINGDAATDEVITIENYDDVPAEIFIIKQKDLPSARTVDEAKAIDRKYDLLIKLRQNSTSTPDKFAKIFTNAGKYIYQSGDLGKKVKLNTYQGPAYRVSQIEEDEALTKTIENRLYQVTIRLMDKKGSLIETYKTKKNVR